MRIGRLLALLGFVVLGMPGVAGLVSTAALADDEHVARTPVVIDTDMAFDDAVTLALALQAAHVDLEAVVATGGALDAERGADMAARLADRFHRTDVPVYRGRDPRVLPGAPAVPPFRAMVERALGSALATPSALEVRAFEPGAYKSAHGKVLVLALGPLTSLAAALREDPAVATAIDAVVVPMETEVRPGWNADRDPDALQAVREAGVVVIGLAPGPPVSAIGEALVPAGPAASLAQSFVGALLAEEGTRSHYLARPLHDELAMAYVLDKTAFAPRSGDGLLAGVVEHVIEDLSRVARLGRQERRMVLLADPLLPKGALNDTLQVRRDAMIAKNGESEWLAQILLNEMHQHLGAFSIIGVKMSLRGAELLNAPQHSMRVVSHAPVEQPMACLDDGLIVGAGSTPGRLLFSKASGDATSIGATFEYGGRRVRLDLKPEFRAKIRGRIAELLQKHTLEDDGYWQGVAEMGLDIWENWHRAEIFTVSSLP